MQTLMLNHLTKHYRMENKMHNAIKILMCVPLFTSTAWAVEVNTPITNTTATKPSTTSAAHTNTPINNNVVAPNTANNKPLTAEQLEKQKALNDAKVKALIKDQTIRLQQLESANLDALAQNQELQLKNDNLGVQIEVLQSERSAQMFIYGAATIAVGIFLGFLIASYIYTKRRRQW